jgi:[histone H4]-N-methyl-L-lysine20 N-methyltransferase
MSHSAPNSEISLSFVAKHIKTKTPEQIDAFATHAWRYFKLYLPSGTVEIAHTARYTWRTGKTELCVLATAPIRAGEYIEQLEGSMARLSPEEDAELSRSRDDGLGSRRDFSVVQVMGGNRSLLFLGPARFVNVRPIFSYSLS